MTIIIRRMIRYILKLVNRLLEPFAETLWKNEISHYAKNADQFTWEKKTFFAGVYQCVVVQHKDQAHGASLGKAQRVCAFFTAVVRYSTAYRAGLPSGAWPVAGWLLQSASAPAFVLKSAALQCPRFRRPSFRTMREIMSWVISIWHCMARCGPQANIWLAQYGLLRRRCAPAGW